MVSNNRRTKLFFKIMFGQLAVAALITALALVVLSYAEGNRFDLKNLRTIRTGLISAEYLPKDSSVYINDKQIKIGKSFAKNVPPGQYNIRISKETYKSWQVDLKIESKSVNVYRNVVLFKDSPRIETLTDARKIALLNGPNDFLASRADRNGLFSNYFEIWVEQKIVARFSTPINQVTWYPDRAHILYQQGKEIRIIEKNGLNDTLLATLGTDSPTKFALSSDGSELYYTDGTDYKLAKIR